MKKIYSLIFFIIYYANGQIINIPDPNFKALLLQADVDNDIAGFVKIDINNNGEIEQSEALSVYYFIIQPGNISDLTGIEYFTNLQDIYCAGNPITTLNLSNLTQLITISFGANQLTNLNLTGLTNLEFILCGGNQLTELDVSTLTALKIVICGQNLFTELDFSNNPVFSQLRADECPNLTTIKINNNYPQNFTPTPYNGCWSGNPNLVNICVDANEVTPIQTFLNDCNIIQPINIYTDCALSNDDFVSNTLRLAPNPTEGNIFFDNSINPFNMASVYNYLGQEILRKKLTPIYNEQLNLSLFDKGIYIVKFSNEKENTFVKVIKN
ncbi:T9SS type A sorting domain-containing protein [Flavobacterium filum]|uniref:T9SS type A sorting domain-containing protein n=1 Tax=Flavobacterium filum TaxID=370974 RepID=UPI00047A88B8|nr:T9SS type A sorting domain-containing protein [Flavobacterium filum]